MYSYHREKMYELSLIKYESVQIYTSTARDGAICLLRPAKDAVFVTTHIHVKLYATSASLSTNVDVMSILRHARYLCSFPNSSCPIYFIGN